MKDDTRYSQFSQKLSNQKMPVIKHNTCIRRGATREKLATSIKHCKRKVRKQQDIGFSGGSGHQDRHKKTEMNSHFYCAEPEGQHLVRRVKEGEGDTRKSSSTMKIVGLASC